MCQVQSAQPQAGHCHPDAAQMGGDSSHAAPGRAAAACGRCLENAGVGHDAGDRAATGACHPEVTQPQGQGEGGTSAATHNTGRSSVLSTSYVLDISSD
jgi:hypothetical protein